MIELEKYYVSNDGLYFYVHGKYMGWTMKMLTGYVSYIDRHT